MGSITLAEWASPLKVNTCPVAGSKRIASSSMSTFVRPSTFSVVGSKATTVLSAPDVANARPAA